MKRIISFTILLSGIFIWLGYSLFSSPDRVVWDYISQECKFVYSLPNNNNNKIPLSFLKMLDNISQSVFKDIFYLIGNSLYDDKNLDIKSFLELNYNKKIKSYIVGYATGQNKIGVVYILESKKENFESLSKSINNRLKQKSKSVTNTEYNGITISTYNMKSELKNGKIGFFGYENYIFLSTNRTLLEESARLINQNDWLKVKSLKHIVFDDKTNSTLGKIFVQGNKTHFLNSFFGLNSNQTNNKNLITRNAIFNISINPNENKLIFDGDFDDSIKNNNVKTNDYIFDYLDTFPKQKSKKNTDYFNYIPFNAKKAIHFNITSFSSWYKNQKTFFLSDLYRDKNSSFGSFKDEQVYRFLDGLKDGITLIELASMEFALQGKMIIAGVKNREKTIEEIQSFQKHDKNDSLLGREYFNKKIIYQLDINGFPKKIFGPVFEDFDLCYFSFINDKLLITNDIEYLTESLNRINLNNTWGSSTKIKVDDSQDVVVSYFENESKLLEQNTAPNANNSKQQEGVPFSKVGNIKDVSAFYRRNNSKVGLKIVYTLDSIKNNIRNERKHSYQENRSYWLDNEIVTPSYTTLDKENNIYSSFQDSDNNLLLIKNFYLSFERTLYGKISSKILMLLSKEKELKQIIFATKDSLFVLDKHGQNVSNFPITYGEGNIFSLERFDDKKKIMLVNRKSNVFIFDEKGKMQGNWSPYIMGYNLSYAPQAIKINNNTYFIFQFKNGNVDIKNIEGKSLTGFPLQINDKLISPIHIKAGINFKDTSFTIIGENGSLSRFNMLGEVLVKEQMVKKNLKTKYFLVLENNQKGYVICEESEGDIKFYNQLNQFLFNVPLSLQNKYKIQYYNFGINNKYYIINDNEQSICYIYNYKHELIGNEPISTIGEIDLFLNKKMHQLHIFSTYESQYHESIIKQ